MPDCSKGLVTVVPPVAITDAKLTSSNVLENDHSEWSNAATYNIGANVIVTAVGAHRIYELAAPTSLNEYPPTNPTIWIDKGATNRWRMFDEYVNSQTTNPSNITIALTPSQRVNALALSNVIATSITVTVTAGAAGTIYNKTFEMIDYSAITDFYQYLFSSTAFKSSLVLTDLPTHSSAVITISIDNPAGVAAAGLVTIGYQIKVGQLMYGYSIGNLSYAKKIVNDDGFVTVKAGRTARIGNFPVRVDYNNIDYLLRELAKYDAQPVLYIGGTQFNAQTIYGFYEKLELVIPHHAWGEYNLQIQGII